MTSFDQANHALRFALELLALTALAWWGFDTGDGLIGKLGLGAGVPLAAAALWGAMVAPRRPVDVSAGVRHFVELAGLAGAAAALAQVVSPDAAGVFAAVAVANAALLSVTQRRGARAPA